MRVLILWADATSKNLGVRALASGAEAMCRRAWEDVKVEHLSYGFEKIPVPVWSTKALTVELLTKRQKFAEWISEFDVVVDTRGGDSFSDIYGAARHRSMCLIAEIVRQSGVPLVMSPQTIGPFSTRVARILARRSMHVAQVVMARDSASAAAAEELSVNGVVHSTDVVFALSQPARREKYDVLLNVSGLLWNANPHVDYTTYRHNVHQVYQTLRATGREVALLSHVLDSTNPDNDTPAVEEFGQMVGESDSSLDSFQPRGRPSISGRRVAGRGITNARLSECHLSWHSSHCARLLAEVHPTTRRHWMANVPGAPGQRL